MLKPLGLAIWIMDDGYWQHSPLTSPSLVSYYIRESEEGRGKREAEVNLLISVLFNNFGLIATKSRRPLSNGEIRFRIRFSCRLIIKRRNLKTLN